MADAVEFALPDPEYERVAWVHNEHFVGSVTPLEQSLQATRARMNDDGLPGSVTINGYGFGREVNIRPATEPSDESIVLGWRERRLPPVDASCAELEAFDPASVAPGQWREVLAGLDQRFWEAFGGVHRDTMGHVFPASALWVDLYSKRFGEERRADALAMLGGFPNASSERASALWSLGRIVVSAPAILATVEAGEVVAGDSAAARAFRAEWDTLMELYGFTTTTHLVDLPTWREDPAIPLGMVAAMAHETDDRAPRLAEQRAARRRAVLEAELSALGNDDDIVLLRRVLAVAKHLAPASEDHNLLCDQRMIAASRIRWLRTGAYLVSRGLLAEPGDIFYLTLDEVIAVLEDSTRTPDERVAERRDRQVRWRAVSPPAGLGAQSAVIAAPTGTVQVVRGTAASAGVYRGRARIVVGLPEAYRLEPGDVLVCPATSPEWTPYFGVVGALVTGTGSLLAHAAVVAREFGIPAVVGATGATLLIPDGAMVTVDGSSGTVTIETAEV